MTFNELRNCILMMYHYPDLASATEWSCYLGNLLQPIRNTRQIWAVKCHQYGISELVHQTSFRRKTSGGLAIWWLFSQAASEHDRGCNSYQHNALCSHFWSFTLYWCPFVFVLLLTQHFRHYNLRTSHESKNDKSYNESPQVWTLALSSYLIYRQNMKDKTYLAPKHHFKKEIGCKSTKRWIRISFCG